MQNSVTWVSQNGPYHDGDVATFVLKWEGATSKSGFFVLREDVPSMLEIFFPGFFQKSVNLLSKQPFSISYTVDAEQVQFPWNVIPVFKYDCVFTVSNSGYFCTEEVGPDFRIITVNAVASWNYNSTSSAAANSSLQLFKKDCDSFDCEATQSSVCKMCEYGESFYCKLLIL